MPGMKRSSGILMHITSLPSPYGIGTMGREAYRFADFLKQCGKKYWQILPLNPTSFGDSPYQCFSTFAGNPYLIDLDMLKEDGLLRKKEYANLDWGSDPHAVDFGKVYEHKFKVLRIAASRSSLLSNKRFRKFCTENDWWLFDYAAFMALKHKNNMRPWTEWPKESLRVHRPEQVKAFAKRHEEEMHFWMFVQFLFYGQWKKLKKYVNKLGIRIIGDIPIYVAADSADVWAGHRH